MPLDAAPPTPQLAWIARVQAPVLVRHRPTTRSQAFESLGRRSPTWGGPNDLLVLNTSRSRGNVWLQVRLKSRAHRSGWIPAHRVALRQTTWRVEVDVSERRLTLRQAGRVRASSRVVVGGPGTPTPRGLFAVDAVVRPPASARLGPQVVAVTAFSPTFETYLGGAPQMGLHAFEWLRAPLGAAASHGCIRLPARVVARIAASVPRGSPVEVVP